MPGTRKLGKTTDQRMAMLRQQVTDLLDKVAWRLPSPAQKRDRSHGRENDKPWQEGR